MPAPIDDLLGAHVSISGGVHTAPERAAAIHSRWTQIFTKAPQQWAEPEFGDAEREAYRAACAEHGVIGTTVHASYLINAASPDPQLYERSVRSLAAEYRRCQTIGADHLVVHPGSATDGDRAAGLARNADAVARVLREAEGPTLLCLEVTSGKGNVLGSTLEELETMISRIADEEPALAERVGVCLDTCHLYAAGYDLRHGYDGVVEGVERTIGLDRVKVWHLNDSQGALGSTTDRHTWIGEGEIGEEGFRRLLGDPRFRDVPMLLETPKGDDPVASDLRNLELLRGFRLG
ncbi:MAG TPA: deoxyribonuclease IV [Longimicrobiaceae bacterium]|nr:deoxyribonuclease IV [Longimicrobiaceae bacterium]